MDQKKSLSRKLNLFKNKTFGNVSTDVVSTDVFLIFTFARDDLQTDSSSFCA